MGTTRGPATDWKPRLAAFGCALAVLLASAPPTGADPLNSTFIVSRPSGLAPVPPGTVNDSFSSTRSVSADGRFVVFTSQADGLLDGAAGREHTHVFVRDTVNNTTELIDRATDSGGSAGAIANASARNFHVAISGDGTKVAFVTSASLDPADGSTDGDVYVRTFGGAPGSDTTQLVSKPDNSLPQASPQSGAEGPAINTNGTKVAFDSTATDLTADDTDPGRDVLVRDTAANTTRLVSRATGASGANGNGSSDEAAINGDGTKIAFRSSADNLGDGDTNTTRDIHVRDTTGGTTTLVSKEDDADGGTIGNSTSLGPSISSDGNKIAFQTFATNFDDGGGIHVRDVSAGTLGLVSRASGATGAPANNTSEQASISYDGASVAFRTAADNLGGGTPTSDQIYLRSGTTTSLVSRVASQPADDQSSQPALGTGSAFVTFTSLADGLSAEDADDFTHVYKGGTSGETKLVSRPTGTGAFPGDGTNFVGGSIGRRTVSADGRFVAFVSAADNISGEDDDRFRNVFVRDNVTDQTILVSRASGAGGTTADATSLDPSISADGRRVAFHSRATTLVPGSVDGNDVYVRDLVANTTTLVSRPNGSATTFADGTSHEAEISADGNRVVFLSNASNLGDGDSDSGADVHVRDLATNATILANRADGPAGAKANGGHHTVRLDADGSRAAFDTSATNLGEGDTNNTQDVYVRDLSANETHWISRSDGSVPFTSNGDSEFAALDDSGERVAFESRGSNFGEGDISALASIYVRDLATGDTSLASRDAGGFSTTNRAERPAISGDGNRVAFETAEPDMVAGNPDPDSGTDVYLRDLAAGVNTLASRADGAAGARLPSDMLLSGLSSNGQCVAFGGPAGLTPAYTGDFFQLYVRSALGDCPDETPPETTVTAGPTGTVAGPTATFEFTSSEAGSGFRCSVDGAPFAPCASPFTTGALADGPHAFEVFAVDPTGNSDPTPASRSFAVATPTIPPDLPPPDTDGPTMLFKALTITMSAKGEIPVALACPAAEPGDCSGRLTLQTAKKVLVRAAAKRKPKIVKLGSKAFKIAPGKSGTVRIKLSKKLRRFVVKSKKLSVTSIAVAHDANGNPKTTTRTLTVKAPRKKKRK